MWLLLVSENGRSFQPVNAVPGTGPLSLPSISPVKPCMEPAQVQEGEERDSIF